MVRCNGCDASGLRFDSHLADFFFFHCFFPGSVQLLPLFKGQYCQVRITRLELGIGQGQLSVRLGLVQCQLSIRLVQCQIRLAQLQIRDRLGQRKVTLGLQLKLRLGCRFIFQLYLLPFYQSFCCCHPGGNTDTAKKM